MLTMNTLIDHTEPQNNLCNRIVQVKILFPRWKEGMELKIKGRATKVKISASLTHGFYVYMNACKGKESKNGVMKIYKYQLGQ